MKRAATITVYTLLREDPPHWQTDADNTASLFDGTAEQLLADLVWVLAAAERAVEIARDQGNDTAAALLGGCVARVHAAIGDS